MIEMEQEVSADPEPRPLDPRWIRYQQIDGMISWLVMAGLLAAATLILTTVAELPLVPVVAPAAGLALVLLLRVWLWPGIAYRHASYRLGRRALEVRRGVLWRSVIDVPRSRMQHSDVSQGPVERWFGLATLTVYTAGTRHSMVRVHGLSHENALATRAHLTQTQGDDVV